MEIELIHQRLKQIKAFVFDVDGVMTDGNVIATEDGDFLRNFNIKDGYALQHAVKAGYKIAIISGGNSLGIIRRFQQLGVQDVYIGQQHKETAFEEFREKYQLEYGEILFMGDDMPDYELMKKSGIAACPYDAADDIIPICHYVSVSSGGHGCVREIIELTMKLQECWWNKQTHFW